MEKLLLKIADHVPSHMDMDYIGGNIIEISSKKNGVKPCMMLSLKKNSKHWFLEIEYLKYLPHQQECQLSGNELLSWVKRLCAKKVVNHIVLADSSYYKFPGTNISIDLTPFSKFTNGMGWYESHGFLPKFSTENRVYQQSFINLCNNSINNLCNLSYFFLKPFLTINPHQEINFLFSEKNRSKIDENYYKNINNYLKKFTTKEVRNSKLELIAEKYKYVFIHILERFGVLLTKKELDKLDVHDYQIYESIKKLEEKNNCVLKSFTPGNTKKLMNKIMEITEKSLLKEEYREMLNYMSFLNDFLKCMTDLGILYTPFELKYPNTTKTYNKSKKRCVSSYKKYSKK